MPPERFLKRAIPQPLTKGYSPKCQVLFICVTVPVESSNSSIPLIAREDKTSSKTTDLPPAFCARQGMYTYIYKYTFCQPQIYRGFLSYLVSGEKEMPLAVVIAKVKCPRSRKAKMSPSWARHSIHLTAYSPQVKGRIECRFAVPTIE